MGKKTNSKTYIGVGLSCVVLLAPLAASVASVNSRDSAASSSSWSYVAPNNLPATDDDNTSVISAARSRVGSVVGSVIASVARSWVDVQEQQADDYYGETRSQLEAQIADLNRRLAVAEATRDQLQNEVNEFRGNQQGIDIVELKGRLNASEEEIARLKNHLTTADAQIRDLNQLLTEKNIQLIAKDDELKAKEEELRGRRNGPFNWVCKKCPETENQPKEQKKHSDNLQKQLSDANSNINSLDRQLNKANNSASSYKRQLDSVNSYKSRYEQEQRDAANLRNQKEKANDRCTKLDSVVSEKDEEIKKKDKKINELTARAEKAEAENIQLKTNQTKVINEIDTFTKKLKQNMRDADNIFEIFNMIYRWLRGEAAPGMTTINNLRSRLQIK